MLYTPPSPHRRGGVPPPALLPSPLGKGDRLRWMRCFNPRPVRGISLCHRQSFRLGWNTSSERLTPPTFSFGGDANPFVLADISPDRGITQSGRQGVGMVHTTNVVSVPNTVILNEA